MVINSNYYYNSFAINTTLNLNLHMMCVHSKFHFKKKKIFFIDSISQ